MDHHDRASPSEDENAAAMRAKLVQEFLRSEDRTAALADDYAARLNLSRSGFYRLTKAFDANRGEVWRHGATGASRLDEDVEEQISLVLDRIGSDAKVADAQAMVVLECRRLGLRPPVKDVVRRRMLERSSVATSAVVGPKLQTDETGLGMGILKDGDAPRIPALCLLIHAPSKRVLAHRLYPVASDEALRDLMNAVGLPETAVLGRPRLKGGAAAAMFGNRFGPFLLRPRAAGRVAAKHYTFRVGIEEARRVVATLVDEHNASRPQI